MIRDRLSRAPRRLVKHSPPWLIRLRKGRGWTPLRLAEFQSYWDRKLLNGNGGFRFRDSIDQEQI